MRRMLLCAYVEGVKSEISLDTD